VLIVSRVPSATPLVGASVLASLTTPTETIAPALAFPFLNVLSTCPSVAVASDMTGFATAIYDSNAHQSASYYTSNDIVVLCKSSRILLLGDLVSIGLICEH
jgi:hypothetical protein